ALKKRMKKIYCILFSFLFVLLFTKQTIAQVAPQTFKYQSEIWNSAGYAILNQAITVKAGIHSGSTTGPLVWEESDTTHTDVRGIFIYYVGKGTSTGAGSLAAFNLIPWQSNSYYLEISVDFGSGYVAV